MNNYHYFSLYSSDDALLKFCRRVMEESPDLIAMLGSDYRFVYANPAYAAVHGVEANELVGHELREYWGDAVFEDNVKPNLDRCFAGEDVRYEEQFHFPGHHPAQMDVRYLPFPEREAVEHAVLIMRDTTTSHHAGLSSSCRERIKALIDIAGKINHDINNPLFAITGYLELLLQIEDDKRKIEYLNSALNNAHRIADMSRMLSSAVTTMEPLLNETISIEIPDRRAPSDAAGTREKND